MDFDFSDFEEVVNFMIATSEELPTRDSIREIVYRFKSIYKATDDQCLQLINKMEARHNVTMNISAVLKEAGFEKWLDSAKSNIEPHYWDRYKKYTNATGLSTQVVLTLDKDTDRILGLLENPTKQAKWNRRGMVIGHVQSGKTANYTGLICKAADAGYKVIIVIAGIHNVLREQTQKRLDHGFLGFDSVTREVIGAGRFGPAGRPNSLTNVLRDFDKSIADVTVPLSNLKNPILFVIKKNHNTLQNLLNWFGQQKMNSGITKVNEPMLLIDDEADNASINIKREQDDISKINGQIRKLLEMFSRSCYIGYTATPFANIFIHPDSDDEMCGDDLFPKNFIVSLDPPSNYVGPGKIFSSDEHTDIGTKKIRYILDNEDLLPVKHKKEFSVEELPGSLKKAVRTFVIAQAIRHVRGQVDEHSSMLVNASRFVDVQRQLDFKLREFIEPIEHSIKVSASLPEEDALKDPEIAALYRVFEEFYMDTGGVKWSEIQSRLYQVITLIRVKVINSKSPDALEYSSSKRGTSVIAVGGISLSRGLTLEGLLVSYFSRNSIMYDTLMQMGRWFGYRNEYEDLCRIWMTEEAEGWYTHISESIEELRAEVRHMEALGATPKDFGLKVKTHPGSLMITARDKLGAGKTFLWSADLQAQRVETWILHRDHSIRELNYTAAQILAKRAFKQSIGDDTNGGMLFTNISSDIVLEFLRSFNNHPACTLTEIEPIVEYIDKRSNGELSLWDVYFPGLKHKNEKSLVDSGMGFEIICQRRSEGKNSISHIESELRIGNKWRMSSRGIDKVGLPLEKIRFAEEQYKKENPGKPNFPDNIYNRVRERPLLAIHLFAIEDNNGNLISKKPYAAWGISFPTSKIKSELVEYRVNTTWMQQNLLDEIDDEEDIEND